MNNKEKISLAIHALMNLYGEEAVVETVEKALKERKEGKEDHIEGEKCLA